jgi:hypothetical protein
MFPPVLFFERFQQRNPSPDLGSILPQARDLEQQQVETTRPQNAIRQKDKKDLVTFIKWGEWVRQPDHGESEQVRHSVRYGHRDRSQGTPNGVRHAHEDYAVKRGEELKKEVGDSKNQRFV